MTGTPAELAGEHWGARARDWAEVQQRTILPASLAVLDELGPWAGQSLLDVGCGTGEFVQLAGDRGAVVSGLDASAALIEIARARNPTGRFLVGDMEHIPFPAAEFSVVTAFNSLHFASSPDRVVAEAMRVTRPGGRIVVATWGPLLQCDALTYLLDLGGLMPPGPEPALDLSDPGTLHRLLSRAGLVPSPWRTVPCPWVYQDLDTALRGLLSTGSATCAINYSGRDRVVETVTESISPYRRTDGSYVLHNTCFYVTALVS
ncbi:class I SAM-dependent methyltransferase [Actinocrispum wychmicini]|uniref:Methyltransferase family protein n=1 Tax=Actinocrispum wychmicini TaxID=1213861 RepID=A0A4R2JKX2_9PSEU|nr:class I SAM-dependent methyltransferase [Actinocrispum wychmicini]TCO54825.1 methyltransferase family protein [Actinocrispum wychmicini]